MRMVGTLLGGSSFSTTSGTSRTTTSVPGGASASPTMKAISPTWWLRIMKLRTGDGHTAALAAGERGGVGVGAGIAAARLAASEHLLLWIEGKVFDGGSFIRFAN